MPCISLYADGNFDSSDSCSTESLLLIGCGVLIPATTSSPCALIRYSPYNSLMPLDGFLVNATPVPDLSFRFPKTIVCTVAPVPNESGILLIFL